VGGAFWDYALCQTHSLRLGIGFRRLPGAWQRERQAE